MTGTSGLINSLTNAGTAAFNMLGIDDSVSTNVNAQIEEMIKVLQSVESASQSDTSQQATSSQQSMQDQLNNILASLTQQSTSTTQQMSQEDLNVLRDQMAAVTTQLNRTMTADYSSEEATQIAQRARDSAIAQVMEEGMGQVLSAGTTTGGYDSTTQQNMARKLAVDAANAGAETELATQAQFGQLNVAQMGQLSSQLAGLFDVLKGSETVTAQDTEQQNRTTEQSQSVGQTTGQTSADSSTSTESSQTTESETERDSSQETNTEQNQDKGGLLDLFGF